MVEGYNLIVPSNAVFAIIFQTYDVSIFLRNNVKLNFKATFMFICTNSKVFNPTI